MGTTALRRRRAYLHARFQTGVIQLEHDFKKQGDYVALVRARSEDGRKEYDARFPFSVGEAFLRDWTAVALATVVAFALGAGWYAHVSASDRRKRPSSATRDGDRSLPLDDGSSRWIVIASATKQSTF